jgi:hypothetical protein
MRGFSPNHASPVNAPVARQFHARRRVTEQRRSATPERFLQYDSPRSSPPIERPRRAARRNGCSATETHSDVLAHSVYRAQSRRAFGAARIGRITFSRTGGPFTIAANAFRASRAQALSQLLRRGHRRRLRDFRPQARRRRQTLWRAASNRDRRRCSRGVLEGQSPPINSQRGVTLRLGQPGRSE